MMDEMRWDDGEDEFLLYVGLPVYNMAYEIENSDDLGLGTRYCNKRM